jgi:toxin YoeB
VKVHFEEIAWDDFVDWHLADAGIVKKILELIQDARRSPFKGLGKPEPLKGSPGRYWSRRIDREHRLVLFGRRQGR